MYTFRIKGQHIVVAPIKEKVEIKIDGAKNLLSLSQLIGEMKDGQTVNALMPSNTLKNDETIGENPKKVYRVLAEFVDLVLVELSQGLPPMRKIQH